MTRTKAQRKRRRLSLIKNRVPRRNMSMSEATHARLYESARDAGSESLGAEIDRLLDRDEEFTHMELAVGETDDD